ncbi:MAG: EthD domain-containing protein [Pseudomonas sp.]
MGCLKVITLIKKRADLTQSDFSNHWRTVHRQLALRLIQAGYFHGYIQNHRMDIEMPGWESVADGAPELWINHPEDLQRLQASDEYQQGAKPDEANFMTLPSTSIVGREQVLIDAPVLCSLDQPIKVMLTVQRAATLAADDFANLWLQGDAPYLMPGAKPLRLTRIAALPGTSSDFDGTESSWWPSLEYFAQKWADRRPTGSGLTTGSAKGLLAREEWIVRPDQAVGINLTDRT